MLLPFEIVSFHYQVVKETMKYGMGCVLSALDELGQLHFSVLVLNNITLGRVAV